MIRNTPFVNNEFYHIYNRGVDKRIIFEKTRDYERFLLALFLFNDTHLKNYHLDRLTFDCLQKSPSKEPLVDIVHWSLMKNHFHLLLRQRVNNGITTFMQRIGTSYSMYFNLKKERSGCLFQGTFKAKHVDTDAYFIRLASYIPLNPLELFFPQWDEQGIPPELCHKAWTALRRYQWSSLNDYFYKRSLNGLIKKESFFQIWGDNLETYRNHLNQFMLKGIPQHIKKDMFSFPSKNKPMVKAEPCPVR